MAERATLVSGLSEDAEIEPAPLGERTPSTLDQLLERVESPSVAVSVQPAPLPQPARLALLRGLRWTNENQLEVALRSGESLLAAVAADVDRELLNQAVLDGQLLLSEWPERGTPLIVGVVHTKPPSKMRFAAEEIELDASRELLLRSGSAALRLRSSGDVELVGSRISAVSRGVMRLIGRLLRLN
jgi:hypothetical protein